jgi:hypothetical protein
MLLAPAEMYASSAGLSNTSLASTGLAAAVSGQFLLTCILDSFS